MSVSFKAHADHGFQDLRLFKGVSVIVDQSSPSGNYIVLCLHESRQNIVSFKDVNDYVNKRLKAVGAQIKSQLEDIDGKVGISPSERSPFYIKVPYAEDAAQVINDLYENRHITFIDFTKIKTALSKLQINCDLSCDQFIEGDFEFILDGSTDLALNPFKSIKMCTSKSEIHENCLVLNVHESLGGTRALFVIQKYVRDRFEANGHHPKIESKQLGQTSTHHIRFDAYDARGVLNILFQNDQVSYELRRAMEPTLRQIENTWYNMSFRLPNEMCFKALIPPQRRADFEGLS